jgi:hypothetical protein
MALTYTALAILGWLTFCALIAWFVGRVLDYAAKIFDDRNREFANADCRVCGEVVRLPDELRAGGQNLIPAGGVADTEHDRPSLTHNTHILLSGPLNGTEA